MRTIPASVSAGLLAAATVLAAAAPAAAQAAGPTIVVQPGESVQAAIDAAPNYGTVVLTAGTYEENLLVTKPLTLRGIGLVRLMPPSTLSANRCAQDTDAQLPDGQLLPVGICVHGVLGGPVDPGAGDLPAVISPVFDVHISGLEIDGFAEGIESDGTTGLTITDVTLSGDVDGIDTFYGVGTVLSHVTVTGATGYAAASLQRSRDVRVVDSTFVGNAGFGLSLLDTRGATVTASRFAHNSGGIAAVDTPAGEQVGALTVTGNTITGNDGYFPGDGSAPPVSGVGIALVGITDSNVSGNRIADNVPSAAAPFGGFGIGLFDATGITGGAVANGNHITGNSISGSPLDLLDASSGTDNIVRGNRTN
jgi:hypothetical protein